MKKFIGFVSLLLFCAQSGVAFGSYSTQCVEFISSHFNGVTDGDFRACQYYNNAYAVACLGELAGLNNISENDFLSMAYCNNQNAVNSIHELATRFNNIDDNAFRAVAASNDPDTANCLDSLASHYSSGISDSMFSACAQ